jgi:hypothetical protein
MPISSTSTGTTITSILHTQHTIITQVRTRPGTGVPTTPGSADTVLHRARIHTHTRRHNGVPMMRLTAPPLAHHHRTITAHHHVRVGRRPSWIVSTASLDWGGLCSSLGCLSPSRSLVHWERAENSPSPSDERCSPFFFSCYDDPPIFIRSLFFFFFLGLPLSHC